MKTAEIFVEYLDHMGTDLTVVNAARTSFGKESDWDMREVTPPGDVPMTVLQKSLKPGDANLIRFLATGYRTGEWNDLLADLDDAFTDGEQPTIEGILWEFKNKAQHWAPFAHPHVSMRIHVPIFLARQLVKHQVGGVWSEESRRYISDEPSFWFPKEWHTRPEDIKQGSGGTVQNQDRAHYLAAHTTDTALESYVALLSEGAAPEEARIVLPLNMMTTVTWTGSLLFWARVCNQRLDSHAQLAAQELARHIADTVRPLFPVSWKELV